jgi:hypothetical protein
MWSQTCHYLLHACHYLIIHYLMRVVTCFMHVITCFMHVITSLFITSCVSLPASCMSLPHYSLHHACHYLLFMIQTPLDYVLYVVNCCKLRIAVCVHHQRKVSEIVKKKTCKGHRSCFVYPLQYSKFLNSFAYGSQYPRLFGSIICTEYEVAKKFNCISNTVAYSPIMHLGLQYLDKVTCL